MTSLIPRTTGLSDLFRFLEDRWPFGQRALRIEHYQDNGNYVLRAELPGVDPDKDVEVTVEGRDLAITAKRPAERRAHDHSEFSYGSFSRTVHLPTEVVAAKCVATYDAGILEVKVPLEPPPELEPVRIEVRTTE
ncbi:Hsp20/alpha crystallin family protein [Kibdelosporangium lantanae]|uniref:Hsp20/alpha crystallin family protein n=1 Tax=Kibdelosporangium lantanae TaxID=1497396 RepID=A0ABW3MKF6_9PSEU